MQQARVRLVIDEGGLRPRPAAGAPPPDPRLAYVIFTSGSTGEPKGVMIEHAAVRNTLADLQVRFGLGPGDRVLGLSALSFDLSVFDLFGLWAAGGAVVLPEAAARRDPAAWLELLRERRVTVWNTVPALLEMLVGHLESAAERLPDSLRLVMLSGDWIPTSLPERLRALHSRAAGRLEIVSLGGATEASIWSIRHAVGAADLAGPSIPYGRPLARQRFEVLDDAFDPRPIGVPGELYIGGRGLARGYWNDPRRTAERFLPAPRAGSGERLYRTGDVGRYLADGATLEFLGRCDLQVKIRGHRVELGDVEACLRRHPGVRAVVASAPGSRGERRLAVHVVCGDPPPALDELRDFLTARLPDYMVPTWIAVVDALPLTANGKIDRAALPDPRVTPVTAKGARSGLRSAAEKRVAEILAEILGLPDGAALSADDDFFALGGDSVMAVRLAARLRREFAAELPLATLFAAPTIADLAAHLERRGPSAEWSPRVEILPGDAAAAPPLFCVHPLGGAVLCYSELARRLAWPGGFYGLQAPGLVPGQQPLESIGELAALHLTAVREVRAAGPYFLAGWSMGALVAYEMACRLSAAGERVGWLVLIDGGPAQAAGLAGQPAPQIDEPALDPGEKERYRALYRAHLRALSTLRPTPAPDRLPAVLLTSSERRASGIDLPADLGWSEVGLEVERVALPGDHRGLMVEPQVGRLATEWRRWAERRILSRS